METAPGQCVAGIGKVSRPEVADFLSRRPRGRRLQQTVSETEMNQPTRTLLAAALAGCFASAANAAAPALGDVLKASGIDVSGYIDVSYQRKSTDDGTNTFHNYDTEQDSFNLHALDVSISSLPT